MYIQKIFSTILKNNYFIAGLLFFLTAIFYSNLLLTGYLGDDAYNSQIAGKLMQEDISLWTMIDAETRGWLRNGSVRFTFYYLIYPLFYYVTDIQYIKLISIFILFFANFSFYLFFSKLVRCNKLGLLATLFMFVLIQYRPWHDPVLGFPSYQVPLISALMFMSFYFYMQFLESNKKVMNLISLILLIFCLCMYEATIPFIPIFGILAFTQNKTLTNRFKDIRYHFFIVSIYFIFIIYLKLFIVESTSYQGASLNLSNITDLIMAFIKEVYAVFPLSYALPTWLSFDTIRNFPENIFNFFKISFLSWMVLIGLLIIFFYCLNSVKPLIDKNNRKKFVLISLNLLIVPAALTALSGHQKEVANISWGLAYLPIYIQYFGLALVMAYVLSEVVNKQSILKKNKLTPILAIIYFFIATITLNENNKIVAKELPKRFSLDLLQQSFNDGFYDEITPEDVLLRQLKYPQDWFWFYFKNLGFEVNLCEIVNVETPWSDHLHLCVGRAPVPAIDIQTNNEWATAYSPDFVNGVNGIAFLSKINKTVFKENNSAIAMYADNIRIYNQKSGEIKVIENIAIDFLKIVNSEYLYTNYEDFKLDDVSGDISFKVSKTTGKREGEIGNFIQWVSGNMSIEIYNNSNKQKKVEIYIEAFSPEKNTKKIDFIQGKEITQTVEFGNGGKINKVKMILFPGMNFFKINTSSSAIKNGDPRNIIYGLRNLKITEVKK